MRSLQKHWRKHTILIIIIRPSSLYLFLRDSTVFDECEIDQKVRSTLLEEIRKKLTPKPLKIRSDIEVSCFAYEGIEAVKKALMAGKQCSTEDMPIKVRTNQN
jgi:translation initiation factor 2 alpha subunit (eIF-2alpha)